MCSFEGLRTATRVGEHTGGASDRHLFQYAQPSTRVGEDAGWTSDRHFVEMSADLFSSDQIIYDQNEYEELGAIPLRIGAARRIVAGGVLAPHQASTPE